MKHRHKTKTIRVEAIQYPIKINLYAKRNKYYPVFAVGSADDVCCESDVCASLVCPFHVDFFSPVLRLFFFICSRYVYMSRVYVTSVYTHRYGVGRGDSWNAKERIDVRRTQHSIHAEIYVYGCVYVCMYVAELLRMSSRATRLGNNLVAVNKPDPGVG